MTRTDPHNGGFFPKEGWTTNDRMQQDRMYTEQPRLSIPATPNHGYAQPQSISTMLREKCHLPAREFVLVTLSDDGAMETFTSPSLQQQNDERTAASFKSAFLHMIRRADPGGNSIPHNYDPSIESHRGFKNARSDDNDEETSASTKRSRRRHGGRSSRETLNDATPVKSRRTHALRIGDSAQVEEFYNTRFRDMQQTACKTVGKAFVKLVEPKKQTHYPYTKGDDMAPPWWPLGIKGTDSYVRHKEPDHLMKKARILLLVHILRMVVQPYAHQHPSVQKVGLNVTKLDEFTTETMGTWFGDNTHPENHKKKAFLKEIFKVAKLEERYLNGEIDGETTVPVALGDMSMRDGEESEDEGLAFDTPDGSANGDIMPAGIPTPDSMPMVSPIVNHHENSMSDPRLHHQLPIRYQNHSMESPSGFSEQPYFPRQNMDTFHQSPTIAEPIRQRAFTSEDYHTPHSGLGWQQSNMATAGPSSAPYYAQHSSSTPIFQMGHAHTLPPPQSMLVPSSGSHFDGLPSLSGRYNPNIGPVAGTQLRTGSLGHPHQMQAHGFETYLHDNEGQFGQHMKQEPQPHNHHQQHQHMHHPQ